jgi:hypothetical protein
MVKSIAREAGDLLKVIRISSAQLETKFRMTLKLNAIVYSPQFIE